MIKARNDGSLDKTIGATEREREKRIFRAELA
jgi:hypothetical protein